MARATLLRRGTIELLNEQVSNQGAFMQPGESRDFHANGIRLRYLRIDWQPPVESREKREKDKVGTWKRGMPNGKTARKAKR